MRKLQKFLADERGQDLLEYALLVMLALLVLGALTTNIGTAIAGVQRRLVMLLDGQPTVASMATIFDLTWLRYVCAAAAAAVLVVIITRRRRRRKQESWGYWD